MGACGAPGSLASIMTRFLLLTLGVLPLCGTLSAATLWDNGLSVNSYSGLCSSGTGVCGGSGSWMILDDFSLASSATITGFTYYSVFYNDFSYSSSAADYQFTLWSLWASHPYGGGAPIGSGVATAVLGPEVNGATPFTVGGLNLAVGPGTYWLGTMNVLGGAALTVFAQGSGGGLLGVLQTDNAGSQFTYSGFDSAFRIEGHTGGAVPEPGTLSLLGVAGAMLALTKKKRRG
jgi:hypothetical protein